MMKLRRFAALILLGTLAQVSAAVAWENDNLHVIDHDDETLGFTLYRSAHPSVESFKLWCKLGVREVMNLAGTADSVEREFAKHCPELKVIYNVNQDDYIPLTREFLRNFDAWVARARASGTKILFRCNCGCHRTGRLAAYYRIKYHGWSANRAIREMYAFGKDMDQHAYLVEEVRALEDYVLGRPCSQPKQFCVPAARR